MADLTVATVAPIRINTWDVPPGINDTAVPRGEVLFNGAQAIPAKAALDQQAWTLQCDFPRNFVYRLVEFRIWLFAEAQSVLDSMPTFFPCRVSSDTPGEEDWFFPVASQAAQMETLAGVPNSSVFNFTSVDPTFWSAYQPIHPLDALIDAGGGAAAVFMRAMNVSGDINVAVTGNFRIRALMYDVAQVRNWPMHFPTPVIGP